MADRFKYSEVRQKIIDAMRTDLIGPREKEEVLEENPRYAYLVGMLDIQSNDEDYSGAGEQEVDADMAFEDGEDFTAGEDDDNCDFRQRRKPQFLLVGVAPQPP